MGLFGKLFEKKICSVCSGEIGLLGNRKLEDGNLCKNCAKKLSPWFDERRHSTVEQIKAQLAYREENQKKVAAFNVTRSFGQGTKILLDEDKRQFMIAKTSNIIEENPDVLDIRQIISCDLDVHENRTEEKRRNDDGSYVSYNPPRYTWHFDFTFSLKVNHPYFDDMHFDLNSASVNIRSCDIPVSRGIFGGQYAPTEHPDYKKFEFMANELRTVLNQLRQQKREEVNSQPMATPVQVNTPQQPVVTVCPACGATVKAAKFCEYCGTPMNG
ncbi:MAG: DUF4428 domain-containing protein [Clostridia bacterium]|nr:DUF4428 domain-containing protein [Clostridia bacterium]